MKNIKNVIIVNDFNYVQGGASKVAIDTARLLRNSGLNVYFFSAVNNPNENIDGITYITTCQKEALKEKNKIKGIINGLYNFKVKNEFKKLLLTLNKNETVIHVHGWTKALSSSVFDIAFKMKFKVVITLHDYFIACPNGGFFNYKESEICKRKPLSLRCITCNCDSRNYAFKFYRIIRQFIQNKVVKLNKKLEYAIGISDLSIEVLKNSFKHNTYIEKIYNPIDFDEKREIINWTKNNYYLYVGRVSKEKGVDIFCKVITELGVKGVIVGDGSEKKRLEKEYSNIEFTGWKTSIEVKEYIKNAKCLIFPSLWYEGAPLTPLESMSYGIPCLVSSCCAGREYCKENTFDNYEDLKIKIKNLENNCSNLNYIEILKKFKVENYKKKLLIFYNKMLNYDKKTNNENSIEK